MAAAPAKASPPPSPAKAAGVEETGKTTKKEEYIDSKLVVEAVGSEEWWCYGEMVLAVGAGPQRLVFASRGSSDPWWIRLGVSLL